jgi:hypothetical protein
VSTSSSIFEWETRELQFRVGRGESCALRFQGDIAAFVSWDHADFAMMADGTLKVTDLKSSNGTYVDGARIAIPTPLQVGSVVQMGRSGPRLEVLEVSTVAAVTPRQISSLPTAIPFEALNAQDPEQESIPSPAKRGRDRSPGAGALSLAIQLVGWIVGAAIGLSVGYYILCMTYPDRYKLPDALLPGLHQNDASQFPSDAADAEASTPLPEAKE